MKTSLFPSRGHCALCALAALAVACSGISLSAAEPRTVSDLGLTLMPIPAGTFTLGSFERNDRDTPPRIGSGRLRFAVCGKAGVAAENRSETKVKWSGKHRPSLTGQGVYPRPLQNPLPIWVGVGGTPNSFIRAGLLGLPLMIAIIGGAHSRFRPLVELYRDAGRKAGHPPEQLKVAIHTLGYVADTNQRAADEFFPGYASEFERIGKERGWSKPTREQFDASCAPSGSLLVGDPEMVAMKVRSIDQALGGIHRISFQMSVAALPHTRALHAINLIGTRVIPLVNSGVRET